MIESFGRIRHVDGYWWVECEPHIRARLKRVFPRAPQHAAKHIRISSTPENTRDLEWFLQRYPMETEHIDLLRNLADEHRQTEKAVAAIFSADRPAVTIELAEPARDYQIVAAQLLDVKKGLLLADDVGLGKTVTSICSIVDGANVPALVVCPTHLPHQWAQMIERFAPSRSVHIVKTGRPYQMKKALRAGVEFKLDPDESPDVVIINYHKLRGWAESLAGNVRLVVFDECQQLRSPGSDIYRAARLVAKEARRRLGLSATPIYNYGAEFFNVVDVLVPGCLGEREEFIREWCKGSYGEKARIADTQEFGGYLRREGIMLRRTRSEVGRELPELTKVVHHVDADSKALDELGGDAVELAKIIVGHNEQFRGEKMQAAGEFDALMRQATGLAKAPYVVEFVKLLLESEQRVVLFGWHRDVYSIWMEQLAHYCPVLYTGSESPNQKASSINQFKNWQSRVLIMSLRSGAGVDGLQGVCRTIVFGELDWSPGVHEQCVGRLHRDGQDEPCIAYFLVAESGADPVMVDVLGVKREQIEGVRNPDRALIERIDTGENSIRRLAREFLEKRGLDTTRQRVLVEGAV